MPLPEDGNVVTLPRKPSTESLCGLKLSKLASVVAGDVTTAGTSEGLMYVGSGVNPPPGKLGSNAEAEFSRCCTGKSKLRVPTYRTSILESRKRACCTPNVQVMTFGCT